MKEQVNLLPPAAKLERARRLYRKRLLFFSRRVVVAFGMLWVVMGGVYWFLWWQGRMLTAREAAEVGSGGEVFGEVARVNELMDVIERHVDRHPTWSPLLDDVVRVLPVEARLTVIALVPETGGLVVRGVSPSRAAVLEMQRQLEALPWVERVEAPLQNFAVGSKGEFSFTLFRKNPA